MKKLKLAIAASLAIMTQAQPVHSQNQGNVNPFYQEYTTVHKTVPFSLVRNEHYMPAIERGIKLHNDEIDAIVNNPSAPTFENTIVALERSGADLNRVLNTFYPLLSADSDDELMEISLEVSKKLSAHSTGISLNQGLWKRIKEVYENKDSYKLLPEDSMLLTTTYDSFARNGANLQGEERERYSTLVSRLSELTTRFGQNVLKELNTYEIWLNADDLSGLPESSVEAASAAAKRP